MTFWGLVVAAGRGHRFGAPKHGQALHGRPLWQWARDSLISAGAAGVVIVGDVPDGVSGGARRRDSVAAGLRHLPPDAEFVLVHDAARPAASAELAARVVARLAAGDVDAVVPAVPVRDTLKTVDGERIGGTVDREALVAVQTPQGFRTEVLRRAHDADDADATDDAALVERLGGMVVFVAGEPGNLKVTFAEDLVVLTALWEGSRNE